MSSAWRPPPPFVFAAAVLAAIVLSPTPSIDDDSIRTPPLPPALIRVGDRALTSSAWRDTNEALRCWLHSGRWARAGSAHAEGADLLPPLYNPDIPAGMRAGGHFLHLYSEETCAPLQQKRGLDLLWAVPRSCERVPAFSPAAMCQVMRGRTLMLIGDSITVGHFETMLQAMNHGRPAWDGSYASLGTFVHPPGAWDYAAENENPVVEHRYAFCRDELGAGAAAAPFSLMLTVNWNFEGYEPSARPSLTYESAYWATNRQFLKREHDAHGLVLVVNRGARWEEDAVVDRDFAAFLQMVHEDLPNATVLFRATNVPHAQCQQYSDPPPGSPPFEPSAYEFIDETEHPEWHWGEMASQSQRIVQPLVEAARDPAAVFLDVAPSTRSRPDQHRRHPPSWQPDCLHFCIPSPVVDLWVHIVFGTLRLIDEAAATNS